jgi:hypothetical protein
MDKDLKNERETNVNRDPNSEQEFEPTRRPSDSFEGSTGSISGEDSGIESEDERTEPTQRSSFAEGSRTSRSHLEN